jgi:L-aminopeptidase/D-esterase-like protein
VAKLHGPSRARPGGLGMSAESGEGATVAALAAVNAFGEIVDDAGEILVGALPGEDDQDTPPWPTNTTIVVVATDAVLSREDAHDLAGSSHQGLARAVRPAHTMWDGDTVFTLATGRTEAPQPLLERLAADVVADAVRRAVTREGNAA